MSRLLEPGAFGALYTFGYMPRAWTVTLVGALVLWLCAYWGTRWTTLLPGLWAGAFAALAPVVVGQILVGPNHDIGGDAGALLTVVAGVLLGPLLVTAALNVIHRGTPGRAPVLPRQIIRVGLVGAAVVLALELVVTWFKLAGSSPFDTTTGLLSMSRLVLLATLLIALAIMGRHRPSTMILPALLITAWIAVGAAMTRIPPPQYFVPTSIPQVTMGYDVPDAPTLATLMSTGRLNLLFAVLVTTGILAYLGMVITLRRRGTAWPISRVLLWCSGWLVVLAATNSGFGRYSAPDFGVHMVVHMSLSMLAPILLVQGGVVTLILRTARIDRRRAGVHSWVTQVLQWPLLRVLCHPAIVFIVFIGSYYGLYFSPLFETMMSVHYAHQLMNLHFLLTGYAYYSLIIGVDRPPRPLPHIGKLGYTFAAMPFHAFFGVAIISAPSLFAENYYRSLDLPWADLERSQQTAGAVAWAGGEIPLIIAIIALCIQWARQDDKEARRRDRHLDRGLDTEFDAYNDMLKTLSDRERTR
ncbi:cytochrome c oxidase assembly protein [Brachybacterium paraconglomeratum]|uniref:cytochrome c oxidase assembly protein n=1 Tax=Brachybacterium paraconglomeratum TaxID=173362 RepID=UPI0037CB98D7